MSTADQGTFRAPGEPNGEPPGASWLPCRSATVLGVRWATRARRVRQPRQCIVAGGAGAGGLMWRARDGSPATDRTSAPPCYSRPRVDGCWFERPAINSSYAASSYSWMTPPRSSRPRMVPAVPATAVGRGAVRSRLRWGRPRCSARRTRRGRSPGDVWRARGRGRGSLLGRCAPSVRRTRSRPGSARG